MPILSFFDTLYSDLSIRSKIIFPLFLCICMILAWRIMKSPVHARSYVKLTGTTPLEAKFFKDLKNQRMSQWKISDAFFIASGIREPHELKKAQDWFTDLTKRAHAELKPYRSTQQRADYLLRWIHENTFSHYQASATDALQLISYGKYNCLSSCIFYGMIGQTLGLKITGIAVDQHAFCKVYAQKKGRKSWDVETTTALGFNPGRNVKISNAVVSVPRNQYRNRRELSILEMIGLIYTNHVGLTGAFPTTEDRLLAYQKAALFLPKDSTIAHNILAAHTQIIQQNQQLGRWKTTQTYLDQLAKFDHRDQYHSRLSTDLWHAHSQRLTAKNKFKQSLDALYEYQKTSPSHLQTFLLYSIGQTHALKSQYVLQRQNIPEASLSYKKAIDYGKRAKTNNQKHRRKYRGSLAKGLQVHKHNYWVAIKNNIITLIQKKECSNGLLWIKQAQKIKPKDSDLREYYALCRKQSKYQKRRKNDQQENQNLQKRYAAIVSLTEQERWQEAMNLLNTYMPQDRDQAKPFKALYQNLDPIIKCEEIWILVNEGSYKKAHQRFKRLKKQYRRNKNVNRLAKEMKNVPRK
jgi:hypothetical protein